MKDASAATDDAPQSAKSNQRAGISERKLRANRENAKKSTGPKTPRGKAFSRQNAIKHGLLVNQTTDFEALDENREEYEKLLEGLWNQYQPVGRAEEVEIERIAVCYWRLKRAWRYENAVNLGARRDVINVELGEQLDYCDEKSKGERAVLAQLQIAKKEMTDTDQLSEETKQRIFALDPKLKNMWLSMNEHLQERMQPGSSTHPGISPEKGALIRDLYIVVEAIGMLERVGEQRADNAVEAVVGRHAIPNSEALDRVLRYETTIERQLNRAIERLDRLQRRRRGEFDPPALNLHLA